MFFILWKKFSNYLFLFCIIIILFFIGSIVLYSATYNCQGEFSPYFIKQSIGFFGGLFIIVTISYIDFKDIMIFGNVFHIMVILLLIFTLIKGSVALGGKRWINLILFKFQPSELAKISLPINLIHYYFYYCIPNKISYKNWFLMLANIFFTGILIIKQPDLGTGLIVIMSSLCLIFIMGIPKKFFILGFILILIAGPIIWCKLHDYQKKRVLVFLGQGDQYKERYQLEQSKIAVGSGGFFGKGFLQGTQKNLHFLPENRTDFIFSVLAEEFGFIGVSSVIFIYFVLIWFVFLTSQNIMHCYLSYLFYYGIFFSFIISIICNISMVLGLLPVVGIPLPCMSYGITHIWGTSISFGILMSILRFNKN